MLQRYSHLKAADLVDRMGEGEQCKLGEAVHFKVVTRRGSNKSSAS